MPGKQLRPANCVSRTRKWAAAIFLSLGLMACGKEGAEDNCGLYSDSELDELRQEADQRVAADPELLILRNFWDEHRAQWKAAESFETNAYAWSATGWTLVATSRVNLVLDFGDGYRLERERNFAADGLEIEITGPEGFLVRYWKQGDHADNARSGFAYGQWGFEEEFEFLHNGTQTEIRSPFAALQRAGSEFSTALFYTHDLGGDALTIEKAAAEKSYRVARNGKKRTLTQEDIKNECPGFPSSVMFVPEASVMTEGSFLN